MQNQYFDYMMLSRSNHSQSQSMLNNQSTLESDIFSMREPANKEMSYLQKYREIKPNQSIK